MSGTYIVALVFVRNTYNATETSLRHGVVTANSKAEALGNFLLGQTEEHEGYVLSNKSVFLAYGYSYDSKLTDEQRAKDTQK